MCVDLRIRPNGSTPGCWYCASLGLVMSTAGHCWNLRSEKLSRSWSKARTLYLQKDERRLYWTAVYIYMWGWRNKHQAITREKIRKITEIFCDCVVLHTCGCPSSHPAPAPGCLGNDDCEGWASGHPVCAGGHTDMQLLTWTQVAQNMLS